jgi:hypothetical protein
VAAAEYGAWPGATGKDGRAWQRRQPTSPGSGSTGNVLPNAAKDAKTDFVQIVFLCRDYRLREAVKACCREGGLDPELLAKLAFMQFSSLLARQRKLSLY